MDGLQDTAGTVLVVGAKVRWAGQEFLVGQLGTAEWHPDQVRLETAPDKGDGPWVRATLVEAVVTALADQIVVPAGVDLAAWIFATVQSDPTLQARLAALADADYTARQAAIAEGRAAVERLAAERAAQESGGPQEGGPGA